MRIIPVLDLMDGRVVRGVAGRRDEYRPIESRIVASHQPVAVALALRERFGLNEFYLADLDAIREDRVPWRGVQALLAADCRLIVDAGVRNATRARELREAGVERVVAAQETLQGAAALRDVVAAVGARHSVFSLDLQGGRLLGPAAGWLTHNPLSRAMEAAECGVTAMIVLDLAGVGVAGGVATLDLCGEIRHELPDVELITGGGVRGRDDLLRLRDAEIDGVLIATALHDGSLTLEDVSHAMA